MPSAQNFKDKYDIHEDAKDVVEMYQELKNEWINNEERGFPQAGMQYCCASKSYQEWAATKPQELQISALADCMVDFDPKQPPMIRQAGDLKNKPYYAGQTMTKRPVAAVSNKVTPLKR